MKLVTFTPSFKISPVSSSIVNTPSSPVVNGLKLPLTILDKLSKYSESPFICHSKLIVSSVILSSSLKTFGLTNGLN